MNRLLLKSIKKGSQNFRLGQLKSNREKKIKRDLLPIINHSIFPSITHPIPMLRLPKLQMFILLLFLIEWLLSSIKDLLQGKFIIKHFLKMSLLINIQNKKIRNLNSAVQGLKLTIIWNQFQHFYWKKTLMKFWAKALKNKEPKLKSLKQPFIHLLKGTKL